MNKAYITHLETTGADNRSESNTYCGLGQHPVRGTREAEKHAVQKQWSDRRWCTGVSVGHCESKKNTVYIPPK